MDEVSWFETAQERLLTMRKFQPLAGVLLGKTSLDWLYGQMNRPPRTVPQFAPADSADSRAGDAAEMIKSLLF
jgi:hypothetical protein